MSHREQLEFKWEDIKKKPHTGGLPKGETSIEIPIGERFGRLVVISEAYPVFAEGSGRFRYFVDCECDCGNVVPVRCDGLLNAKEGHGTKSCGCLQREKSADALRKTRLKHGLSTERLYHIWKGVIHRCYTKSASGYPHYGGRGICVCEEWRSDYLSFRSWAINNGYSKGLTIERLDVNGNYEPGNCSWISGELQARNTTKIRPVTAFGETKLLIDWFSDSRLLVPPSTLRYRLNNNWDAETAFTQKAHRRKE